ncbi:MAG: LysR family transcriptional regulator substrate-binding protein, partial [Pyrinomonadaceae bacterium]
ADPLPALLKALRKEHPQADISVVSGTSDSLVNSMLAGELDMAFVSLPVEASGITTDVLSRDELVAIVSPSHPRAKQKEIDATALANEKLILGGSGGNTRRLIDQFFASAGMDPTPIMELSRQTAIIRMVEENLGVGITPLNSVRDQVASEKLVSLTIKGRDSREKIYWELGLARASGGYNSPLRRSFTRLCLRHYGKPYASKKKKA